MFRFSLLSIFVLIAVMATLLALLFGYGIPIRFWLDAVLLLLIVIYLAAHLLKLLGLHVAINDRFRLGEIPTSWRGVGIAFVVLFFVGTHLISHTGFPGGHIGPLLATIGIVGMLMGFISYMFIKHA